MDSLTIIFILNGIFFSSFFLLKNIYISFVLALASLFILIFISKQKKQPSVIKELHFPSFTFTNNHYIITIVCLIILFVLEKFIGFTPALLASFFIFVYVNKLDSRASFFIAIILLIITAFLSISGNTGGAENTAVLVYYFLVIGVVWQIIELRKEKTEEKTQSVRQKEIKNIVSNTYMTYQKPRNFFFTKKNIIMVCVFALIIFIGAIYIGYTKLYIEKTVPVEQSKTIPVVSPTPMLLKNIPFTILNGTDIRGLAGSSAATLQKAGWENEFNISTGNYEGTASSNMLKYTKNLEDKIPLLEQDLKIVITPIVLSDATREAEMILILGN